MPQLNEMSWLEISIKMMFIYFILLINFHFFLLYDFKEKYKNLNFYNFMIL